MMRDDAVMEAESALATQKETEARSHSEQPNKENRATVLNTALDGTVTKAKTETMTEIPTKNAMDETEDTPALASEKRKGSLGLETDEITLREDTADLQDAEAPPKRKRLRKNTGETRSKDSPLTATKDTFSEQDGDKDTSADENQGKSKEKNTEHGECKNTDKITTTSDADNHKALAKRSAAAGAPPQALFPLFARQPQAKKAASKTAKSGNQKLSAFFAPKGAPTPPLSKAKLNTDSSRASDGEETANSRKDTETCPPATTAAATTATAAEDPGQSTKEGEAMQEPAEAMCTGSPESAVEDTEGGEDIEGEEAAESNARMQSEWVQDEKDLLSEVAWKKGQSVPYQSIAQLFAKIEAITGRLEIQALLTRFFRQILALSPHDLLPAVYLCCNKFAPAVEGVEIGIGDALIIKAIVESMGKSSTAVKSEYQALGDLGLVAEAAKSKQVWSKLLSIAKASGSKSQDRKVGTIKQMFVAAKEGEVRYIVRALQGKLRIGLAEQTVLTALAHACCYTPPFPRTLPGEHRSSEDGGDESAVPILDASRLSAAKRRLLFSTPPPPAAAAKLASASASADSASKSSASGSQSSASETSASVSASASETSASAAASGARLDGSQDWPSLLSAAEQLLKQVYSECPSYHKVIPAMLDAGIHNLSLFCHLEPGFPVQPMLAKPSKGISEALDRFQNVDFTCEYKYDGERAQIHFLPDGSTHIFSRNLENHTGKYPDVIHFMKEIKPASVRSAILDCEVVAYDRVQHKLLPFQVLSTRSRKDVTQDNIKVTVKLFAFDMLYLNGKSYLRESLRTRREQLRSNFEEKKGFFHFATSSDGRDENDISDFLNKSVSDNCEGLMLKLLDKDSSYEPSRRTFSWLKLKKDYLEGFGDSLDLVPIGAYYGRGKRTGKYGAYLLACYNPEEEEYQTVCKVATGINDEALASLYNGLKEKVVETAPNYYNYSSFLEPEVFFEPSQVWEVKCADLSISPHHTAAVGLVDENKGIALRFPRFIRVREDKTPEIATTSEQVAEFYNNQGLHSVQGGNGGNDF